MIKQDIPLYKLDLTGVSPFNAKIGESMKRASVKNNNIVIPPQAPFYQKSFKMYDKSGKELDEGTDYEFYGIMGKLTQYTGQPVGLFVRLLDDDLLEWSVDYQVVGNFGVITNEILNMLNSITTDDRYVFWDNIENKPLWFVPELHQHDLAYDVYGFTDLVTQLNRMATWVAASTGVADFKFQLFQDNLDVWIAGFKKILFDQIDAHNASMVNDHGVDKSDIGLGNVDNYKTATLEETLDGLRDDLHITIYNAAQAAAAASGRNDKLFPSGALPMLRYGSDTFIPPTISGSFEGLGGTSRRAGAIIETDGTLLILTHRNNGKYRGLYFTRCINWQSADANYDFTSYLYQHPTATAAGATLDTIINGSNRYVMVVGDRVKNLWWWCETHGTFNPDRHVLIPLSGEWVSQDMAAAYSVSDLYELSSLACIVADKDYADYWTIVQPYTVQEFINRRPSQYPEYATIGSQAWGNGAIINAGCSFNIVASKSGTIKRATVDFTHPIWGNYKDKYWAPWLPKVEKINGSYVTTSAFAKYDPPIVNIINFRSICAYWLNTGNLGEYAFRYEHIGNQQSSGNTIQHEVVYRATLNIIRDGSEFTVGIKPATGNDKLFTIDIDKAGTKEWDSYIKNVTTSFVPGAGMDQTGSAVLTGGYVSFEQGTAGVAFPPAYGLGKSKFLGSPEALLTPPNGENNFELLYNNKVFVEQNPLGMTSQFAIQRLLSSDNDDYTKAGILVRQFKGSRPSWFFRPVSYMNSNWEHIAPPNLSTFQGQAFQHYPFTPAGLSCTMGLQVFPGTQMPISGRSNQGNQKKFLGATCDTTVDGVPPNGYPNGAGKFVGDSILPYEVAIKTVDGVMSVTPSIAINLKNTLTNVIVPAFVAAGLTENDVRETWAVHMALNPTGEWHAIWVAFRVANRNLLAAAMVTTLTPAGTPTTVNGYSLYPDATCTKKSAVKTELRTNQGPNDIYNHPNYAGNGASLPYFLSMPFKGVSNGARDLSGYVAFMSTSTRYNSFGGGLPAAFMMEIKADGSEITKLGNTFVQDWGTDNTLSAMPYYGATNAATGTSTFEGAAIAGSVYDQTGNIFDNIGANKTAGNPIIGMSNILTPQYTVYFQQALGVLIAGKMYDIPATYIDILTIDSSPANKIFYIYLQYSNGQGIYSITKDPRPESSSQALIATVACGPTQIDRIQPYNRFSMDGGQVKTNHLGSGIFASTGSIFEIGNTSAILLSTDFIPE